MITFNKIKDIDELLKLAGEELGVINQIDNMIAYADGLQNTQSQQLSKTKNIYWDAAAQSENLKKIFENLKIQVQGFFEQTVAIADVSTSLDMSETAIMSIIKLISAREVSVDKVTDINNIIGVIRDTFIDGVSDNLQKFLNNQPQEETHQQTYEIFYPNQNSTDYT
jgi:hypothetical protein